ncbi:YhcH/YjgK/YiaL family protein [Paenibacillus nasutitermitis]|uniref:YhcH/YjgK/YiaL family protein n=1 Tax=Paenibacillus nasutitermitis TaxID=1652958 RepID=A0A916YJP5_9BACL|nr:YhcH/YjgK/YiaL family protein [Paenibacillus nasutitermitis]GGD47682.1 hypothetical protein GCM10010911_01500 [Paenibacillus nasutitermitis]
MIVGSMEHWASRRKFAHPVLRKAIDYLAKTDLGMLEVGKYPIWGGDMFALVMEIKTKGIADQPAEKHENFLDIHYLLQGKETIGWKMQDDNCKPCQSYNPEEDFALFAGLEEESLVKLKPGMFMVLFPEDIHRPGLTEAASSDVRKVVVKINRNLF